MIRLATIALVAVVALGACGACHHEASGKSGDSPAVTPSQPQLELATVGAAPPHWTDEIPARVVFDETRTSRIGAPLAGRVSAVMVELGQHVKAGAPLVTVTSGDLADLYGALAKAQHDLTAAQADYERVKGLVDVGSLPQKDLTTVQQALAQAQVALSNAQQKLSSLKVGGNGDTQFTIVAPREGVVVEKNVAVGQQVSPDAGSILAIADLSNVWIVADLLEDAVDDIRAGGKAEITLDTPPKLEGVVDQVAQIVDPVAHTVPVRVKLANATGALRPNALAQIRFFEDRTGPLSVPADALLSDGASTYVYVVKDGVPKRQEVVAGPRNAKMIPIRSGLAVGDQVVARGAGLLDNQLPVEELPRNPP